MSGFDIDPLHLHAETPMPHFLLSGRFLFAITLMLAQQVFLESAEITFHSQVEVLDFKPPGRVVLLKNGRFGAVAKRQYFVSEDDGKSWQAVAAIDRGEGPAITGGILIETHEEHLVFIYNDMENYHLDRTENNMPLPGANLDIWSVRSADGGQSWEAPQRLLDGYCGAMIGGICLRNNRIVLPLQDLRYDPPRHVTVVYTSDDNGATWQTSKDLDIGGYGWKTVGSKARWCSAMTIRCCCICVLRVIGCGGRKAPMGGNGRCLRRPISRPPTHRPICLLWRAVDWRWLGISCIPRGKSIGRVARRQGMPSGPTMFTGKNFRWPSPTTRARAGLRRL